MTVYASGNVGERRARHGHGLRAAAVIAAFSSVACSAAAGDDGVGVPVDIASAKQVRQLPAGVPVEHHYYNPSTGEHRTMAAEPPLEEPVYSNMPPPDVYLALGLPDILVADDIQTAAVNGCSISAYEILVSGGGDGSGPGFTATFALYDDCPGGGGQVIPGTEGSITTGNDAMQYIVVDLSDVPVAVDRSFWIGVSFDSGSAGWVLGTPADVGYTRNVYDFMFEPCHARFGGTNLYAGFHARVWCEPPYTAEFPAYINDDLTGDQWSVGAGYWAVDDVELIVDDCILSSYEIGAVGTGDVDVTITAQLQRSCVYGSNPLVEGTQAEAQFFADGSPSLARFVFPGGVDLGGGASFFLAYKFDRGASTIVTGPAWLGFTEEMLGEQDNAGNCTMWWDIGWGFPININCLGSPPQGACCDSNAPGGELCRQTAEARCLGPLQRWAEGGDCADPHAFDPPCGSAACCLPPYSPFGETCRDMSEAECGDPDNQDGAGNPAVWQPGQFCYEGQQDCISWVCRFAEGPCDLVHPSLGCNVPTCCDVVCDQDPFCCLFGWDSTCVARAHAYCGDSFPVANDDCYSPVPGAGAIMLNECSDNHDQCFADADCPLGQQCLADGATTMTNDRATVSSGEGFCCHPDGAGMTGYGGIWAKFTATETSARVHTCAANNEPATDALLQVFRATDHSSPEAACSSLVPIRCNDDGGCLDEGQASICLYDLTIGETYYVLLDSKTAGTKGYYRVSVESPAAEPCADPDQVPDNDTCDLATQVIGTTTFDLTNAAVECPMDSCAPDMTGDVWFEYVGLGNGIVTIDTCGQPDQDTILIAYDGGDCPTTTDGWIVCNDDAGGACGVGSSITFSVDELERYHVRLAARNGDEFTGTLSISDVALDCNENGIPDVDDIADGTSHDCNDNGWPDECDITWGFSIDANGDGIPDECCILAESTPPTCAVDARQPHLPNDAGALQGWDSIALQFTCGGMLPSAAADAYALSDPTLTIVGVTVAEYTATLQFDRQITPGQWTCITYNETGESVCIGSLPGDVSGDRVTDPADIISLIDCINEVSAIPCEAWQTDIDRGGGCDPSDIIRLIDLLNGANAFASWLGAELPTAAGGCP